MGCPGSYDRERTKCNLGQGKEPEESKEFKESKELPISLGNMIYAKRSPNIAPCSYILDSFNSSDSLDSLDSYSLSSVTFLSSRRCLGVSPSASTFWILSRTSMPSTTLPKTVY